MLHSFQIVGGWGFLYTSLPKEQTEGIYVSGPEYVFEPSNSSNYFKSKYYKRFNSYPNFDAAFSYEAIRAISENCEGIKNSKNLKEYFKNRTINSDVLGEYTFDDEGNLIIKTDLGVIRNGNIEKNTNH